MWEAILAAIISFIGGGSLAVIITAKATKKKATAEAKTVELDNVQEAVKIWREMAEGLRDELLKRDESNNSLMDEIQSLRKEVKRLSVLNKQFIELLDKITPENCDEIKVKIQSLHNEG